MTHKLLQATLQKRLAELHLYEEINEHYAQCAAGAENLRDWVAERMDKPVQPAQRQPLTDEQVFDLMEANTKWMPAAGVWRLNEVEFARAIEAKLKERNS